jgi:hypothetical protein
MVTLDLETYRRRFNKKIRLDSNTGCIEWAASTNGKYGLFWYEGRHEKAHRMAWFFEYGRWSDLNICHKCDNMICVNIEHLFEGSQKENVADMFAKGRENRARGERQGLSVLTEEKVKEIKALLKTGMKRIDIANLYGVADCTIGDIKAGRTWRHV